MPIAVNLLVFEASPFLDSVMDSLAQQDYDKQSLTVNVLLAPGINSPDTSAAKKRTIPPLAALFAKRCGCVRGCTTLIPLPAAIATVCAFFFFFFFFFFGG